MSDGKPDAEAAERKYVYTFNVWPSDGMGFQREMFDVFRLLNTRVEMPFTEEEFEIFRAALIFSGFTLRAVVRVPHHEPEVVL